MIEKTGTRGKRKEVLKCHPHPHDFPPKLVSLMTVIITFCICTIVSCAKKNFYGGWYCLHLTKTMVSAEILSSFMDEVSFSMKRILVPAPCPAHELTCARAHTVSEGWLLVQPFWHLRIHGCAEPPKIRSHPTCTKRSFVTLIWAEQMPGRVAVENTGCPANFE